MSQINPFNCIKNLPVCLHSTYFMVNLRENVSDNPAWAKRFAESQVSKISDVVRKGLGNGGKQ